MRLCGVTTRFHRVTKLVSGHTVSSWMGGKRNRVVEGKGRRRDGRRKKWRKEKLGREREEEREERKVWWMVPCVGEGWTAISSRKKKILGCIVFKDRGKGSKKLARVWCSATSDGERVFAIQSGAFRPWNIHARTEMRKRGEVSMQWWKITWGERGEPWK